MKLGKISLLGLILCGSVAFANEKSDKAQKAQTKKTTKTETTAKKSLYDRLGGKAAIEAVVADFTTNVAADTRINSYFKNTNIAQLNTKLAAQICEATGGPCKYAGMDMKTAHSEANLKRASGGVHGRIGDAEFTALVEDLTKSLDKFKVPTQEKTELLTALAAMKDDMVTPPKKQM